jgi:hypothetical protein
MKTHKMKIELARQLPLKNREMPRILQRALRDLTDFSPALSLLSRRLTMNRRFTLSHKSNIKIKKLTAKFHYFYSQWGLIPRPSGAVRIGNVNKKMVVDPIVNNFLTERASSIRQRLQDTPPLVAGRLIIIMPTGQLFNIN